MEQPNASQELATPTLQPIGQLVSETCQLGRKLFWKILFFPFAYVLIGALPLIIALVFFALTTELHLQGMVVNVLYVLVGLVGLAGLGTVVYAALIAGVIPFMLIKNNDLTFKGLYPECKQVVGDYFFTMFLAALVTLAAFIAFVIPGIIVLVWYIFVPFVLVFEGLSGMAALRRSQELAKGYWWPIAGRLMLLFIPSIVILIPYFIAPEGTSTERVFDTLDTIVSTILKPFYLVMTYLIFKNLTALKGASKLEVKPAGKGRTAVVVLIILIPLIGILSTLAVVSLNTVRIKARNEKRTADMTALQTGLQIYFNDNDKYPASLAEFLKPPYSLPAQSIQDPQTLINYNYVSTGADFKLCATKEGETTDNAPAQEECFDKLGPIKK